MKLTIHNHLTRDIGGAGQLKGVSWLYHPKEGNVSGARYRPIEERGKNYGASKHPGYPLPDKPSDWAAAYMIDGKKIKIAAREDGSYSGSGFSASSAESARNKLHGMGAKFYGWE